MLKMMATLEADAILQALTSSSPSGKHTNANTNTFVYVVYRFHTVMENLAISSNIFILFYIFVFM